jgi:hypothetical protein
VSYSPRQGSQGAVCRGARGVRRQGLHSALPKRRNIADQLPDKDKAWVDAKLVKAFGHPDPAQGLGNAKSLAAQLEKSYPVCARRSVKGYRRCSPWPGWASTVASRRR